MDDAKPSHTAYRVAMRRAAHQLLDEPKVFDDPLALKVLGPQAAESLADGALRNDPLSRGLRAFLAVRSRYAEDELASAVASGVRQYIVLGAGLDTFAYRNPHAAAGLRVFEVDHPATQAWKIEVLKKAGIDIPDTVAFAAMNFERQTLADGLRQAGFDASKPAFCAWLGVVPYLTADAFGRTIDYLGKLPATSGLAFDYGVPPSTLSFVERMAFKALATRVAAAGEPFQLYFEPAELREQLTRVGFHEIDDLGTRELNERYFAGRTDGFWLRGSVGRLLRARV